MYYYRLLNQLHKDKHVPIVKEAWDFFSNEKPVLYYAEEASVHLDKVEGIPSLAVKVVGEGEGWLFIFVEGLPPNVCKDDPRIGYTAVQDYYEVAEEVKATFKENKNVYLP